MQARRPSAAKMQPKSDLTHQALPGHVRIPVEAPIVDKTSSHSATAVFHAAYVHDSAKTISASIHETSLQRDGISMHLWRRILQGNRAAQVVMAHASIECMKQSSAPRPTPKGTVHALSTFFSRHTSVTRPLWHGHPRGWRPR
jgi:hypothetical protein